MAESKLTKVLLVVPDLGLKQEFEITHAERILRLPQTGGWRLPEDSKFIFDYKNGIGLKPNKPNSVSAKK